ncbi:bifunctional uroporphyrinogen-III C-methyltransferase/uroporphyrinogen-III synthase [Nostocoides jenkinsii]|uniref:Putative uroporphyrin-III C-methyltransferase/uroporphyrinogen-III synthase n=1 Tax=Nostocoides jenkinsii Ben 74 TaxID=1193518 RepID=A0A077MG28_9MICO|nr:bifunctional uroporphyrinogen-III C-methyltransferase/uroporphyrinogen-III synthase [Tetrasphaera jenkinsii]CCI54267.1 putative uroporphyrin-III C-methyltransferase/uroporphyrinogen-III synthase [Tetrasphaera jenkinsii Ben 74]
MSRQPSSTTGPRVPATVAFVGTGPGDPSLLTLAAVEALRTADVVVTDELTTAALVSTYARPEVTVVDASHGTSGRELTHASRAKLVVQAAKQHPGGQIVRLMDGDPSTFNGVAEEAQACRRAGLSIEIIPGVSAVTAVPAYAGIPLTGPGVANVVVPSSSGPRTDMSAGVSSATSVVLLGGSAELTAQLAGLLRAGREPSSPVALIERGTTTEQHTVITTLEHAADAVAGLGHPSMAIVGPTVALHDKLAWFENKPLFGWKVLLPRTKEQSAPVATALARHGAEAVVVPTISVEPPRTRHQMDKAITGLVTGRYEWVGFTSVNAVKAVRERFEEVGLDARAFAGLKVAAVGGVTAEALRSWGINPDLVPSGESSARGLLEDWPEYDEQLDPINRVFLPRADIATDTLVAGLMDLGWEVEDATAYRTVRAAPPAPAVREAIKTGEFDAVVFTSSSTVRNLVGIAGKPHAATVVACIGPQTAKTAQEHGLRVDVLASEASVATLVEELAEYGRARIREAAQAGQAVVRPSAQRKQAARRRAR